MEPFYLLIIMIVILAFIIASSSNDHNGEPIAILLFFTLGVYLAYSACQSKWQGWALELELANYNQKTGVMEYVTKENILVSLQQAEEQRIKESSNNSSLEQTVLDCE